LESCSSSSRVYEGRVINLRVDQVLLEDKRTVVREVVEHRGATAIVALLDDGNVILVRQYRYAISSDLLEIPAGTLEIGEDSDRCARRELEEETGYRAGRLERIMECYLAPGYSSEKIQIYLATNLQRTQMNTEEDEQIRVELIPLADSLEKIRNGEIHDAKTVCGLYRAAELLDTAGRGA
jgi:ADP-ribose pyrophosphatase